MFENYYFSKLKTPSNRPILPHPTLQNKPIVIVHQKNTMGFGIELYVVHQIKIWKHRIKPSHTLHSITVILFDVLLKYYIIRHFHIFIHQIARQRGTSNLGRQTFLWQFYICAIVLITHNSGSFNACKSFHWIVFQYKQRYKAAYLLSFLARFFNLLTITPCQIHRSSISLRWPILQKKVHGFYSARE